MRGLTKVGLQDRFSLFFLFVSKGSFSPFQCHCAGFHSEHVFFPMHDVGLDPLVSRPAEQSFNRALEEEQKCLLVDCTVSASFVLHLESSNEFCITIGQFQLQSEADRLIMIGWK